MNEVKVHRTVSNIWIRRGERRVGAGRELAADVGVRGGGAGRGDVAVEGERVAAGGNRIARDRVELIGAAAQREVLGHQVKAGEVVADGPVRRERDGAGG